MGKIMGLTIVLCLSLSRIAAPARAEDAEVKAAEAITTLGGTITRDEKAAGKPLIGVSFKHTGITIEGLKELKAALPEASILR